MAYSNGSDLLLMVWCIGVGGSVLALSCLLLERSPRRLYGRIMAGAAALISCVGSGVCAAGNPPEVWGPIAGLALVCVLAWATHYPAFLRFTRRLARPRAIWLFLLVAGPLYAVYCTRNVNAPAFDDLKVFNQFILRREAVPDLRFRTDQGREIKPYRFVLSPEAELAEQEWIGEMNLEYRVIRTADLSPDSNCHGWVFTGGSCALQGADVEKILADNGYRVVQEPREGDVIIYRNSGGEIEHTGLVRHATDRELVLIESKWGPLGRFLHPPEHQPYGDIFAYYRSNRPGHQLQVLTTADKRYSTAHAKKPAGPSPGA